MGRVGRKYWVYAEKKNITKGKQTENKNKIDNTNKEEEEEEEKKKT